MSIFDACSDLDEALHVLRDARITYMLVPQKKEMREREKERKRGREEERKEKERRKTKETYRREEKERRKKTRKDIAEDDDEDEAEDTSHYSELINYSSQFYLCTVFLNYLELQLHFRLVFEFEV